MCAWHFDPHHGGTKIPDSIKSQVQQRVTGYANKHYSGKFSRLGFRFKSQFCYIDAYTEPSVPESFDEERFGISREDYIERLRTTPTHLCRIRYFGGDKWSMAFFTYSNEKYTPSYFVTGQETGTPEEAFEASAIYLN
ncbi:hypothetical protein [Endozoicomonas sp. 8E]|uniref:hypothetical protein n=1 Tax=Endozoicomonas sp. 8E TaxID=3035692 RepID=UPI002939408A|nr:hypothetical protein [Endozoicomonas sp. 8E]WOG28720.1 hypothetical protein P6910_03430 [Endozoicomonas sp. 8E]